MKKFEILKDFLDSHKYLFDYDISLLRIKIIYSPLTSYVVYDGFLFKRSHYRKILEDIGTIPGFNIFDICKFKPFLERLYDIKYRHNNDKFDKSFILTKLSDIIVDFCSVYFRDLHYYGNYTFNEEVDYIDDCKKFLSDLIEMYKILKDDINYSKKFFFKSLQEFLEKYTKPDYYII